MSLPPASTPLRRSTDLFVPAKVHEHGAAKSVGVSPRCSYILASKALATVDRLRPMAAVLAYR